MTNDISKYQEKVMPGADLNANIQLLNNTDGLIQDQSMMCDDHLIPFNATYA